MGRPALRSIEFDYFYRMHSYQELLALFEDFFKKHRFPEFPSTLYEPCSYLLNMGGKRIRPLLCLMSHELFAELDENAMNTAMAIELFHNFTLMHDDIMDQAPLRRGKPTVHLKYNTSTAILSGDVMNIYAYEHLNKIKTEYIHAVIQLFNKTAIEICEGQQLDMDFEKLDRISLDEYMQMITLKTSVLLGTSIKLGALLGGATDGCSQILFEFGKSLGLAFQLMDDYLDAFGDPAKTGKQTGGDILANKKTYLTTKAYAIADEKMQQALHQALNGSSEDKVQKVLDLFNQLDIKTRTSEEINLHTENAFRLLEKAPILSKRKIHLKTLAESLLSRQY